MSESALAGWTPLRVCWPQGQPHVDWGWLGAERFTDPFFEQTIARALRHPARLLFRRQTPIEVLERVDGPPPNGFIFHLSRCGSTLLAQMLAALPQSVVISEAPPLDQVLAVHFRAPGIGRAQRIAWFRGMVRALGQPRRGDERLHFVKFDSWHALELPLIREAFPDVPWIFLYRDPVEIMVSQQRQRGTQMIPGIVDPRLYGFDPVAIAAISLDDFAARVLGRIADAAVEHASLGGGRLVNFTQLPAALWESLGGHFGVEWSADDVARMQRAAQSNAKTPAQPHADDRAAKQREAGAELRQLTDRWVGEAYRRLEARRLAAD